MQFINYFFASAISFSGLLAGLMLVRIAPEEQKPLEKYFIIIRKILLALIFIFPVPFYFYSSYIYFGALLAYFAFLIFIEYRMEDLFKKSIVIYSLLGILFFLSSKNTNLIVIESSLIFLYGLPAASLAYGKKKKNHYRIISCNIGFLIIANLLFFT